MKYLKVFISLFVVFVLLLSTTACGNSKTADAVSRVSYDELKIGQGVQSGKVAENENYTLSWDSERACIILEDKLGNVWSTIPYEYYKSGEMSGRANTMMGAPLMIEYISVKNKSAIKSMNGYTGIIKNGRISSKKTDNGILVYYCFDKLEIVIPVEYTLRKNGLGVSIIPEKIIEYDNLVYKISVSPFFCSAKNTSDKSNQYVVVPSGSGALMYTDERVSAAVREYSERVYGNDPTRYQSQKLINTETIRIPIFGAKDGETAFCGIIEKGSAAAYIDAIVGDEKIGWSGVYPTFQLRGSNVSAIAFDGGQTTDVENISEEMTGYDEITVAYYPLTGASANYSGMASVYQDYLVQANNLSEKKTSESQLTLNILGGLQLKKLFLGIPYQKTVAATNFTEALEIIKQVNKNSKLNTDVVLTGFGESGLDIGKIAGGYSFASVFGNDKDFNKLNEYCKNENIDLFTDFDIVRFNKSSGGFSKTFNAAKSANLFTAYQYYYSISLRNEDDERENYVLLNRSSLDNAAEKLFKFAEKKKIVGIGLSSLGNTAYSDYDERKYYVRGNSESDAIKIINKAKEKDLSIVISKANGYSGAVADKIIDSPVTSSMYDSLDIDIPLYQMVFKGITDVSVPSVNTAVNPRIRFLQAIESGSGLSFTLSANYDTDYATSIHSAFAVSLFSDNSELILELSNESKDYYDAIKGSKIKEHIILSDTLRKTVFDNGVILWVNYGTEDAVLSDGIVKAESFLFKEGIE